MENLFIIFDPSFLAYVWPKIKNGVHLNIEHLCWDDVSVFLKDLAEGRSWAYRAADASGRYPSGLFEGRRFWLGSKEQCLLLDRNRKPKETNETWGEFYSGEYLNALLRREKEFGGNIEEWHSLLQRDELMRRVVDADNEAPVSLSYTSLQITLNVTKFTMPKSYEITLGLCLPRTCMAEDVLSIINFSIMINDNLKTIRTVSRSIKITSLRHVENSYDIKTDIGAVTLILITLTLVILSIIATVVDLDLLKLKSNNEETSFDLQKYNCEKKIVEDQRDNVFKVTSPLETKEETLSMKNFYEFKKAMREKSMPPSITLDVMTAEGIPSCKRCGKYKKQCVNPMQMENIPPCPRVKYNSCTSLTTEFQRKDSLWKSLLLSFSLKHSWMRIFNTTMANKDLAMVHGLKILAVLWIIFVHVAVTVNTIAENGGDVNDHNNVYYILSTGTLAFDTLFFASGLFSAQHFFYLKGRNSAKELVNMGGLCGQTLQLLCFITNRALRLLPPYVYTIFLTSTLARVSRDTAALSLPERDYINCDSYWWRNLLYLTTLYPREEQCMQISWYLSAETQLHMFGALLCLLIANKKHRISAALAISLLLGATAYDVVTAYSDFGQRVPNAFALYSVMISRPWSRAAPYVSGAAGGALLHAAAGDCAVAAITSYCFWAVTVVTLTASLAVPLAASGWVSAGTHLAWPVALLWPALICATKYSATTRRLLSSAPAAGASRLCYGALLLHGALLRALLLSADTALCSRFVCLLCYFAGSTVVTLVSALCLSLLVEMPGCCLLRRLSDYTYR
ncbi:unnamed protein product [Euphydryas editha]|uniref:Nose resistant-to-fluoxetine protein N-terminal domain-containing protein n=1 Tax=Euphydryas editha TaxID=104508 RepID=A0AAU9UMM9_EUPED|nr:unnamed protein product [Euphydryas editha]